ncbi:outer membrane lipoprotein-sorting protein [candidate division KSB3 bacterium]|uniref:Outer membrane lipoprotein-sorting protein n=1 Tax=candidate division KSB3 bacterium TaxID=2044937 RepID=A0A9D5JV01_9BACT|nr:outer membrane lipoprotein-sorting protein [candidate division KSB3 bacterium]MBD3324619.1 outer membrane lipoprotein-sorting protein [candidate division KSB3 bacterium]
MRGRGRYGILGSILIAFMALGTLQAQALETDTILKKVDAAEGFESSYSEVEQIITTSSGQKRTLVVRGWAVNNGEKQLSEYLAPPDIKGQRILMTDDGDNIWMFNPETRRTRKLGSHMKKKKVMGSDFTYEDQAGGKISEKYTGTVLREEEQGDVACYVMELIPTPAGPSYDKLIAWIGKEDFLTRRVDYYQNGESEPFKRLILEDIHEADGKLVAHSMTMTNLEDMTETVNKITRIQFNVDIPDSVFESRNLER